MAVWASNHRHIYNLHVQISVNRLTGRHCLLINEGEGREKSGHTQRYKKIRALYISNCIYAIVYGLVVAPLRSIWVMASNLTRVLLGDIIWVKNKFNLFVRNPFRRVHVPERHRRVGRR
jgi:hypothetical protein